MPLLHSTPRFCLSMAVAIRFNKAEPAIAKKHQKPLQVFIARGACAGAVLSGPRNTLLVKRTYGRG
eukprot:scaffold662299_cov69-Prasinocladus_malaysianus.AAC.1